MLITKTLNLCNKKINKDVRRTFVRFMYGGFPAGTILLVPSYIGFWQKLSNHIKSAFCKGKMHATQIDYTVFENKALQSLNALTSNKSTYVHDKEITKISILGNKFGKNETQYIAWKDVPDVENIYPKDLKHFKVSRKAINAADLAFQKMLRFSNTSIVFRKIGVPLSYRYKCVTPQNKVVLKIINNLYHE